MKRIFAILLAALLLPAASCAPEATPAEEPPAEELTFRGTLTGRNKETAQVAVFEDEEEYRSGDLIEFSVGDLERIDAEVGDVVEVTYTGLILETYPCRVNATGWRFISASQEPEAVLKEPERNPIVVPEVPEIPLLGDKPPVLYLNNGQEVQQAWAGGYTWTTEQTTGLISSVIACGMHPLNSTEDAPMIAVLAGTKLELRFDVEPISLTIRCWSSEFWGDESSYEANFLHPDLEKKDNTWLLSPPTEEQYVYELSAIWGTERKADYIFCTASQGG